jgi:four helix bundle protein
MNPEADKLKARTKQFALDVIAFLRTVQSNDESRDIKQQLLDSGSGTAAAYRRACRSRSRAEFIARIGLALEEADESALWLELMIEGKLTANRTASTLLEEANALSAIFAQSSLTATSHLQR